MRQREDGKVRAEVELPSFLYKLEDWLKAVQVATEDLEDPCMRIETDRYEIGIMVIEGWRESTVEDLAAIGRRQEEARKAARTQLRNLRREHPELFDGQGKPIEF